MKIKFFNAVLCIVLSMGVKSTRAQTTYTDGIITYKTVLQGQDVEMKEYFSADSVANIFSAGRPI